MKLFQRKGKDEKSDQFDFELQRKFMVKKLIKEGRISKPDVINAMEAVPRELFVLPENISNAYQDTPLSIGKGQTISAPHMVGIMVEALDLKPGQKVLEVGAGSGYHAAVVAEIVKPQGKVYSVEIISYLIDFAKKNIKNAGLDDVVEIILGDGSVGLKEHSPFDRIFVACASPDIPPPLLNQLKNDGKLLIPAGEGFYSELIECHKTNNDIMKKNLGGCAFVPMKGKYGFKKVN
jgi:protein-L-isoaspartate(D-aspartate) O-methyltransferase